MYKHTLTIADQYLAKEQELPKNKTVEGNGTPLHLGGGIGGMVELKLKNRSGRSVKPDLRSDRL